MIIENDERVFERELNAFWQEIPPERIISHQFSTCFRQNTEETLPCLWLSMAITYTE